VALSLTPRHFVTKMEENVKRVDNRLDDYIKDSNENNIHDIRTATRRLDASYRSLPKKIRRKNKISKYMWFTLCRHQKIFLLVFYVLMALV